MDTLRNDKYLYLMFALPLAYYLIFHYYPMYGLTLAFKDFSPRKGILGSPWAGLMYVRQFLQDPYFWTVFKNTIVLNVFNMIWSFPIPILLALLMNELKFPGFKKAVQTISYLPHFISTVVVVGMLVNFLSTDGLVNRLLGHLNLGPFQFLTEIRYFRSLYIVSEIWQTAGWSSIIYLSALSAVDVQLYEAATVDGAGRFRQLVHITLSGIAPTISIMFILQTGQMMTVSFQKILLLLNGPIMPVADVISTYVYRQGILGADFSYSTGVGLFQSVISVLFVVVTNAISRKIGETSLW